MCLGFEPRAPGWKVQTNPLSYGGTPILIFFARQGRDDRGDADLDLDERWGQAQVPTGETTMLL